MPNPIITSLKVNTRRTILLHGISIAVGGPAFSVSYASKTLAQTKLSHEQAKYQETPKNGQKCSTCIQFVAPASCKIIADPIKPDGWCQFYGAKSA